MPNPQPTHVPISTFLSVASMMKEASTEIAGYQAQIKTLQAQAAAIPANDAAQIAALNAQITALQGQMATAQATFTTQLNAAQTELQQIFAAADSFDTSSLTSPVNGP